MSDSAHFRTIFRKALDDVAEIFIKVMRKFESSAKIRLQKYQLEHAGVLGKLPGQGLTAWCLPACESIARVGVSSGLGLFCTFLSES